MVDCQLSSLVTGVYDDSHGQDAIGSSTENSYIYEEMYAYTYGIYTFPMDPAVPSYEV